MSVKLENIISGYRINMDDADWLRSIEADSDRFLSEREKVKK